MAKPTKNVRPEIVEEIIEEPVKAPKPRKKTKTGKVFNCELLNVREKASIESNIIRTIPSGTTVELLDEENGFYKIEDGYIMKSYVEI